MRLFLFFLFFFTADYFMAVSCNQSQLIESIPDGEDGSGSWVREIEGMMSVGAGWGQRDKKKERGSRGDKIIEGQRQRLTWWGHLMWKPIFDGGLNIPCRLGTSVSLSWTHMLGKLSPGVKWIHHGTALGISERRKMETSIWLGLQRRKTPPLGPLWLRQVAVMTCSAVREAGVGMRGHGGGAEAIYYSLHHPWNINIYRR